MLVSLGLDHRRADLAVRERFHLDDTDVTRICGKLTAGGAAETVVVRTCNRLEVYGWWPASDASAGPGDPIREIGRAWAGDDDRAARLLAENARVRTADTAVRHLFRVSSGLESQIVGDIHILGQVRRSLRDAVEVGSIGSHLHRLFETALRVGKQVQRSTHLMSSRRSVGSEAARRAADRVGSLAGRTCIVVGCGKSGTQAARTLQALGATDLVVLNRSRARAEKLARELGSARAGSLDRLPHELGRAGVVIVATGAPEPIVHADDWGDRVPDPSARTLGTSPWTSAACRTSSSSISTVSGRRPPTTSAHGARRSRRPRRSSRSRSTSTCSGWRFALRTAHCVRSTRCCRRSAGASSSTWRLRPTPPRRRGTHPPWPTGRPIASWRG